MPSPATNQPRRNFGTCNGFPIAEDHRRYVDAVQDGHLRCVVEYGLFKHLERRLADADRQFAGKIWQRVGSGGSDADAAHPEL
jgi:hypothetical protein